MVNLYAHAMHNARIGCHYDPDLGTVASGYWCDELPSNFNTGSRERAWNNHYKDATALLINLERLEGDDATTQKTQ